MLIDTDLSTELASQRATLAQVNLLIYQLLDEFSKHCCTKTPGADQKSGPSATGSKTSAEGEIDF